MSIRNEKGKGSTVVCDVCQRDGPRHLAPASAGTIANRLGWRAISIGGRGKPVHVCPSCFKEWLPSERLAEFINRKRRNADNNTRE